MNINIDTNALKDLTPNQYIYLYSEYIGEKISFILTSEEIDDLCEKGFIDFYSIEEDLIVELNRSKFINTYISTCSFDEILLLYPHRVESGDGKVRYLRPANAKGKEYESLKKRYEDQVRDTNEHSLVIKCLQKELSDKRDSLFYMPELATWINQSRWQRYISNVDAVDNKASIQDRRWK